MLRFFPQVSVAQMKILKWSDVSVGPMLAAEGNILTVPAQQDLIAFLDDFTIVYAGIADGLFTAPADSLDFLDRISPGHQPMTAFKKVILEIGAKAIGDDRNIQIIHDMNKKSDLIFRQKLGFINDNASIA